MRQGDEKSLAMQEMDDSVGCEDAYDGSETEHESDDEGLDRSFHVSFLDCSGI